MNTAKEQYAPHATRRLGSQAATATAEAVARDSHQRLSPAVRRLAAEYRLDLEGRQRLRPQRPHHAAQRARVHSARSRPRRRSPRAPRLAAVAGARCPPRRRAARLAPLRPRPRRRPARRRCRSRASASSRPSTWSARRPRARTCCKPSRSTSTASTSCARPCATRGRRARPLADVLAVHRERRVPRARGLSELELERARRLARAAPERQLSASPSISAPRASSRPSSRTPTA